MRLINAATLMLEDFSLKAKPKYAILSHTWEVDEEVSYQEMLNKSSSQKKGWDKIRNTCTLTLRNGLSYVWVDTCCIDKTSSAELSEAINSMFAWYQDAEECYAFLSDFSPGGHDRIQDCRWWTRGWTLQELIAPRRLTFFDASWKPVGLRDELCDDIAQYSGIPASVLCHERKLSDFSVAERMSWASKRSTTRKEDEAYCLLGLFDISMPLIYGEGTKAFRRLQEEIIKRSHDLTIFAGVRKNVLLANSPHDFESCAGIGAHRLGLKPLIEFYITNMGLRFPDQTDIDIIQPDHYPERQIFALRVGSRSSDREEVMDFYLCLKKIGPTVYGLHPEFSGAIARPMSVFRDYLVLSNACIIDNHNGGSYPHSISEIRVDYERAVSVYIPPLSNDFQLRTVGPKLLWDVEQRCLTDLPEYGSSSYYDRVNMALIRVRPETFDVQILVFWWISRREVFKLWDSYSVMEVRVVDISPQYEKARGFLHSNRSGIISRENFLNRFSIKNCNSSVKIQVGRESITIHAILRRLEYRAERDAYNLELDVTQPVTDGIIDKDIEQFLR